MDNDNNDNKVINITGTNNRYQIKKLINENRDKKNRVQYKNFNNNLPSYEEQFEVLKYIKSNEENNYKLNWNNTYYETNILINRELEKKINSYKQQDIEKKLYCLEKFININNIINKLVECEMKCYYCKCEMYILYKIVRETKQWTVDRIDNNQGHNLDNYVLACLECNLKRRRMNSDNFLFTKQLKLNKLDK